MIKKSTLAFALVFVLGSSPAWAQKAEITPFIGYQFGGKVALVNGDVKLKDAANFDFTLPEDSPALQVGFEPFDVSDVGPREESLKHLPRTYLSRNRP